jgi:hypothetical protein
MITNILTIGDVEDFMRQIIAEGTNAHPDEDFHNYIIIATGEPSYTPEEAATRNNLMSQCFDVCNVAGQDVYSVMHEIFLIETGLDKFIPLPSALL